MPGRRQGVDLANSGAAITQWLGFGPSGSSARLGWSKSAVHSWRGSVTKTHFGEFDQPVMVLHIGGAKSVPVQFGRRWADSNSCPGLVTIVPPGTPITWHVDGEVHSHTVHLGLGCFDKLIDADRAALLGRIRSDCGRKDGVLSSLISALVAEIEAPSELGPLYVDSISDGLALHLIRVATECGWSALRHPTSGLPARTLRRAIEQIDSNLENGVSLQELADAAGLSRAHFARSFRQSTGQSPHRFLTERRLGTARDRLQNTTEAIADIALGCGFSSQAHFSQYFREATGMTPGAYRRARS